MENYKNYILRAISGLFIIGVMIYGIYGPFLAFCLVMLTIFAGMIKEWHHITHNNLKDTLIGFFLIFVAIFSLIIIKFFKNGNDSLLWYFISIWSFDSFAMIGGKFINGRKLAEKLSPMKTWSGLISGLYGAVFLVSIASLTLNLQDFKHFYIFSLPLIIPTTIICLTAQMGDLLESYYKRKYGIKDSGTIIPGHGGVLDRFDSILISAPVLLILLML